MAQRPSVFVGIPTRGLMAAGTALSLLQMGRTKVYCVRYFSSSLLSVAFNSLWTDALNERPGFTHFVMLHDDIVPCDPGWLDTLMDAHARSRADVTSCVIPIKDERGLASTAFYHAEMNKIKRLTMTEAVVLPSVFSAAQAGYPGCSVLPNTGLWVCDFTKPWVESICFTIRDKNFRDDKGRWVTQCFSEDWDFGVQCHNLKVKVAGTTAVRVVHKGGFDYPNFAAFGTKKEDDAVGAWEPPAVVRRIPEPVWDKQ